MKTARSRWFGLASLAALAAGLLIIYYAVAQNSGAPDSGKGNNQAMTLAAGGPVTLNNEPARVLLEGSNIVSRVQALLPNQHVYLVLREQHAAEQPGILYHVYLNLPQDAKPAKGDVHYVGTLNFYNAVPLESGGGSNPGIFRSYDVTAVLKNLVQQKAVADQVTVTIAPSGAAAANAKASIGRIELVEQ